jgi:hypothetical protein
MHSRLLALVGVACGAACGDEDAPRGSGPPISRRPACPELVNRTIGGAKIASSAVVPARRGLPEYCEVQAAIASDLELEVRLPTTWNGKLLYLGTRGWGGTIPLSSSVRPETAEYVIVGSNSGHASRQDPPHLDASPFLNDPAAKERFAAIAVQLTLTAARAIVQERYGRAPSRHYFHGCSGAGREGLVQANRFSESFDGIIASAPAIRMSRWLAAMSSRARRLATAPLPAAKADRLARAFLDRCDALDGLADGIVHNLGDCRFEAGDLICRGNTRDPAGCLTPTEVATARAALSPLGFADGSLLYPRYPRPSLGTSLTEWAGDGTAPGMWQAFGDGAVKYWLMSDPAYDCARFDPDAHRPEIEAMGRLTDATPDVGGFFARGGKLILIHGTDDLGASYHDTVAYFDEVAAAVGGAGLRDASAELFLLPGVQHCFGGTGPEDVDLVGALDRWVEEDRRPSTSGLVLRKLDAAGQAVLSRPLCRHPRFAHYRGRGEEGAAASFDCVKERPADVDPMIGAAPSDAGDPAR